MPIRQFRKIFVRGLQSYRYSVESKLEVRYNWLSVKEMLPIPALALLIPAIALLALAVKRVPDGEAWTVYRLGKHIRTLQPGLRLIFPGVDRIARHVSLIGHHVAVQVRALGAADASADLYYQILDPVQAGKTLADISSEGVDDAVIREADDAVSALAARLPQQAGWSAAAADALKQEMNNRVTRMGLRVIRCALHTA